nr:MAG TPA: hypothetical protein [Caudoviricetes sp.]
MSSYNANKKEKSRAKAPTNQATQKGKKKWNRKS